MGKELERKLTEEILELVDNQKEYTRSDIQGRATAITKKAMRGD